MNNPPTELLTNKAGTTKPGQSDSFLARMRELEDFKFALDAHAILAVTMRIIKDYWAKSESSPR